MELILRQGGELQLALTLCFPRLPLVFASDVKICWYGLGFNPFAGLSAP